MSVSQKIARPARTAGQGGLAYAIVEVIDSFGADFTTRQYGALLLLLTIVVGYLQVLIEDRTGKGLLRKVPGPEVEVVEEQPAAAQGPVRGPDGKFAPKA